MPGAGSAATTAEKKSNRYNPAGLTLVEAASQGETSVVEYLIDVCSLPVDDLCCC